MLVVKNIILANTHVQQRLCYTIASWEGWDGGEDEICCRGHFNLIVAAVNLIILVWNDQVET